MTSEKTSSPSRDSQFSVPWTRASLLNIPTYLGSDDFLSCVQWSKTGIQNDLVEARTQDASKETPPIRATCAIVGIISPNRLLLEPHGNFNPNFEKNTLETSKAQFQLVPPTVHAEFDADFNRGISHIQSLQKKAIQEGPDGEHFIVADGQNRALRFSWPLFEKRVSLYDPTDEEDWTNGYPIAAKYRDLFDDIASRWRATPLPAFDADGKLIEVRDLELSLTGALALVHFQLRHYAIKNKRTNGIAGNTFSAIATQVKILERPVERRSSPYKSMLLKGPTILPQTPSIKRDQTNAVKAFHPALTAATNNASTSSPEQTITPASSQAQGKKRAIDNDDDATATDEDTGTLANTEKASKKRKTQHK